MSGCSSAAPRSTSVTVPTSPATPGEATVTYSVTGTARTVNLIWLVPSRVGGGSLATNNIVDYALRSGWSQTISIPSDFPSKLPLTLGAVIATHSAGTLTCTISQGTKVIAQNRGSGSFGTQVICQGVAATTGPSTT